MTLTLSVSCLGKSHAGAALSGTDCTHCESFSLASSLRSWIDFFSESDSAPRALPFSSSQGPVRKKHQGRGFEQPVTSELTPAQCPRASPSPQREHSPVLFTQHDQRPSAAASDMISFGVVWAFLCWLQTRKSYLALWLTPPSSASRNTRLRADEELIRVMTKAVNEIGLEWSSPEKPSRSRLDECFLPGRHQALRQMLVPLLPWSTRWAHEIVTCPLLVRATEPHHRAVQSHITDSGCAYSAAGQAVSALHSMAVLQVFQAKMLAYEEAGLDSASLRDLRSATDLALLATKATSQAIGRSLSSLIVLERHLWLTMTEMKEADKVPFLDVPVSSGSLFGPAVEGFAEYFTEAQKSSQTMQHFLPKRTALPLLPVAPDLRRLSRQLNQGQPPRSPDLLRVGEIEGAHARHDATPSRSTKDPGPRSPWIRRLRNPPEQPVRKRRGPSLATLNHPVSSLYSNHFYCHITTAQVPWWVKFLWACSRQCKKQKTNKKNNLHMDSTYLQTVQKTMCKIHIHILSTHSVL